MPPFELQIGGGYRIVIPDRINLGASGYFIPIPHRRLIFSFIRGLLLIIIAAGIMAYREYRSNNSQPKRAFTVAGDGSGDFTTISAAVSAAPDHCTSPFRIYIKTGVYAEHVKVGRAKTHLEFVGDGIDKTIVAFGLSEAELNRTYNAATVYVRGDDFIARYITFVNHAGPSRGGAPAFTSEGNRTVLYRCKFQTYRATVYARYGYQFYRECEIYGSSNIIFGSAVAVFQNCTIFAGMPLPQDRITVTAHGVRSAPSAFSLHICTITRDPDQAAGPHGYLGSPWPPSSTTVVMQSFMDEIIHPYAWLLHNIIRGGPFGYYGEYDNRGPGATRHHSAPILTPQSARNFTVATLLHGGEWLPQTGGPIVDVPPEVDKVCKRADRDYYRNIYDFCVRVLLSDKRTTPNADLPAFGFVGLDFEFVNASDTYDRIHQEDARKCYGRQELLQYMPSVVRHHIPSHQVRQGGPPQKGLRDVLLPTSRVLCFTKYIFTFSCVSFIFDTYKMPPFELQIGGGYRIVIPDRINLGASGYFIPIPHRRLIFSFIRGLLLIIIAAGIMAYREYRNAQPERAFTVAGDGSGDFTTISAAVAAAPDHCTSPFRIYIKASVYAEHVKVGLAKTHLEFLGDGMDKTIIMYNLSEAELNRTYSAATVYVRGDDFTARDITFINHAGPRRGGAPAFTSEGNRTVLYRCKFQAYRATVYARYGYQFYRDCDLHGTSNIIFGSARAVFQSCTIFAGMPLGGDRITVTAHAARTPRKEPSVFSLHNCTVTREPVAVPAGARVLAYLGSPWPAMSTTVVMQSLLDKLVHPRGWLLDNINGPSRCCAEYDNRGPGAKRLNTTTLGRSAIINLTAQSALNFTVAKLLHGDEWLPSTGITYVMDSSVRYLALLLLLLHGYCCYTAGVDAVDVPPEVDRVCKRADRDYIPTVYDFCVQFLLIDKRTPTANLTMLGFIGLDSEFVNVSLTYEYIKMMRQNATGDKICYDICLQLYDNVFLAMKYGKGALSEKDYERFYYMISAITGIVDSCDFCFDHPGKFNPFKQRNFHVRGIQVSILGVASLLLGWP
ncbi:hypothetical protein H6P81_015179 [Aristolochia fimbriata]|uniref:Pectinesterase catalytic domain-containing protein n=1 Tax=Aristolochia fimbriata TaxID=158543 RepID=A0AAV7E4W4_ARIFI|nr:hypothetical protein H6P81_015179 [Aristolochia fimbriata]